MFTKSLLCTLKTSSINQCCKDSLLNLISAWLFGVVGASNKEGSLSDFFFMISEKPEKAGNVITEIKKTAVEVQLLNMEGKDHLRLFTVTDCTSHNVSYRQIKQCGFHLKVLRKRSQICWRTPAPCEMIR